MDGYRITGASFKVSVGEASQLEAPSLPEVAFVGRSNVGKSSLINVLCNQKKLARTSKDPGRTRLINFFTVTYREERGEGDELEHGDSQLCYFVDLPGYGYAAVSKDMRKQWERVISAYLSDRESLAALVLLVDSRREPKEEEQFFLDTVGADRLIICATKSDKLNQSERHQSIKRLTSVLPVSEEHILFTSTLGKKENVDVLRNLICEYIAEE